MSSPETRGWGPGWPNCQAGNMVTLTRPDGLRQPVRREIAPLVLWLMNETERRGYDIVPYGTWGYACRAIRGYANVPSNHSWGLAVDINAPRNPMLSGAPGWQALHDSGRTNMPSWMPGLWGAFGFTWGGDYSSRQDAMHYEFLLTPADCARITASLTGTTPAKPPPVVYLLDRTLHVGDQGPMHSASNHLGNIIGHAQDELRTFAWKYKAPDCDPGPSDGNYGPRSGAASKAFKTRMNFFQPKVFSLPADTTFGGREQAAVDFWNGQ